MVARHPAFSGRPSAVIFDAILNQSPPSIARLNPAAPAELERVVFKALEKDRNIRYQTAADLRSDLLRLTRSTAATETSASMSAAAPVELITTAKKKTTRART